MSSNERNETVLSWRNLEVVLTKKFKKSWRAEELVYENLLSNVNGYCKSGECLAILGASGAGKTTLLTALSQKSPLKHSGEILVNGEPINRVTMAKISGFVPQHDIVFQTLTVLEHMEFMAKLMMDREEKNRERKIRQRLSEFGLLHCVDARLEKLSGGEKKRLSLAVQLLSDPLILFCDEPTSGLDSYNAGVVVEHLRTCAGRGIAVLSTIHQPASGVFDLFHGVLLLAAGRVAYFGPVDDAHAFFKEMGLICPDNFNPAEFYVKHLAVMPGDEAKCTERNKLFCERFQESKRGLALDKFLSETSCCRFAKDSSERLIDASIDKVGSFTQFYLLFWRSCLKTKREGASLRISFIYLLIEIMYLPIVIILSSKEINQASIQNIQGMVLIAVNALIYCASTTVTYTFSPEMPLMLREVSSGLYGFTPYFLSKLIIVIIISIFETWILASLLFLIAQFHPDLYSAFIIPFVLSGLAGAGFGLAISAAFESHSTASLVLVPLQVIPNLFAGFQINLNSLPSYTAWLKYISIWFYAMEMVSSILWKDIEHIECPTDPSLPCISNGTQVLEFFGYDSHLYTADFFWLLLFFGVCVTIGYLALWRRSKKLPVY